MVRTPRILVAGGSKITPLVAQVGAELGLLLMKRTHFVLVTGGVRSEPERGLIASDNVVAAAASQALESPSEIAVRIQTVIPEREEEDARKRHHIGQVITLKMSDRRTRRYAMVIDCDAVIAMHGERGTREIIDLAFMAGKPLILLPTTEGSAKTCWDDYREGLIERLRLTSGEVQKLETSVDPAELAELCLNLIARLLRPGCFMAVPFGAGRLEDACAAIRASIEASGYQAVVLNEEKFTGSAVDAVWNQIESCALVVADLTNHRPNVYYETGIAHALRKRTILLVHSPAGTVPDDIPFDLKGHQILPYRDSNTLSRELVDLLADTESNRIFDRRRG